jgi:hypothetical protein
MVPRIDKRLPDSRIIGLNEKSRYRDDSKQPVLDSNQIFWSTELYHPPSQMYRTTTTKPEQTRYTKIQPLNHNRTEIQPYKTTEPEKIFWYSELYPPDQSRTDLQNTTRLPETTTSKTITGIQT